MMAFGWKSFGSHRRVAASSAVAADGGGSPNDAVRSSALAMIDPSIDSGRDPAKQSYCQPQYGAESYDRPCQVIEQLRGQVACPVILLGAAEETDASPRIAVNLAIALTRRSLRVLLVETDPASTDLATIFDESTGPGFFEWRRGDAWISQATHASVMPGLSVMLSGAPTAEQNAGELDMRREQHRWANLSNSFDVMLLYGPAAMAGVSGRGEKTAVTCLGDLADGIVSMVSDQGDLAGKAQRIATAVAGSKGMYLGMIIAKTGSRDDKSRYRDGQEDSLTGSFARRKETRQRMAPAKHLRLACVEVALALRTLVQGMTHGLVLGIALILAVLNKPFGFVGETAKDILGIVGVMVSIMTAILAGVFVLLR